MSDSSLVAAYHFKSDLLSALVTGGLLREGIRLVTLQPIQAGEELSISYLGEMPAENMPADARKARLREIYG